MIRLSRFLILCLGLIAFSVLTTACQGGTKLAGTTATSRPTFTPPPSRTPRPSQTPRPTATPSPTESSTSTATFTNTPKPTIQLPKLALTPLPFTPEPISVQNARRISELTRWEITNPEFWVKSDGSTVPGVDELASNWDFHLAFSKNGAALVLLPDTGIVKSKYDFTCGNYVGNESKNSFIFNTCLNMDSAECVFPGIPRLSIPEGKQINLVASEGLVVSPDKSFEYLYSPNGETLATQSYPDCQIQFSDLETGSSTGKIVPPIGDLFDFSADGKVFWSGPDEDGYISFFDPENGELLQKIKVKWRHLAEWITTNLTEAQQQELKNDLVDLQVMKILDLSPDRKTFISFITKERVNPNDLLKIVLWRMSGGVMLHVLLVQDGWEGEPIASYSPDSKLLAIYAGGDQKIGLFDVITGELIRQIGESDYLRLAYSSDGQILIAGTNESLELWDIATGNLLAEIPIPAKLDDWAISPDGRYIGTVSEDGIINLWGVQPRGYSERQSLEANIVFGYGFVEAEKGKSQSEIS